MRWRTPLGGLEGRKKGNDGEKGKGRREKGDGKGGTGKLEEMKGKRGPHPSHQGWEQIDAYSCYCVWCQTPRDNRTERHNVQTLGNEFAAF